MRENGIFGVEKAGRVCVRQEGIAKGGPRVDDSG